MNLQQKYKDTLELLTRYGQEHLLAFYDELNEQEQESLLSQIEKLDFDSIPGWIEEHVKNDHSMVVPTEFSPAPSFAPAPTSDEQKVLYDKAKMLGSELISAGKVAAFVVAGGQGTRLGFDGPKGNYPISPVKNKTLFRIFAETILAASSKYAADIPWYIMTSPLNHADTIKIFESEDYYGLDRSNVFIFQQGTCVNFDLDGKILLADKSTIATSPDGHGGSFKALFTSGALADMKDRGIQYISYWQVDNPLVYIIDPLFIGLHAKANAQMSSKALKKISPTEKVGNFCLVDGKVTVIEYSDLPEKIANRKNSDGSLVFELGSIGIHIASTDFIEKLTRGTFALPMHRAVKNISHVDKNGDVVSPTEPNGVKLETFVFDALPLADESVILQTLREEEFAPVKNATGADSAEVTRRMITERAAIWLGSAGISVPGKSDGSSDCTLEISPALALAPEDLKQKIDRIGQIKPGDALHLR